jgi:hypothetical protein
LTASLIVKRILFSESVLGRVGFCAFSGAGLVERRWAAAGRANAMIEANMSAVLVINSLTGKE